MKKWILVIGVLLTFNAKAESCTPDNQTCFECGAKCTMKLTYETDDSGNQIGTLTVSGQGAMGNYYYHQEIDEYGDYYSRPWAGLAGNVQNIKIEEGITSVGFNAFFRFENLKNIELPQSLREIQPGGLEYCTSLENLTIPDNVTIYQQALETTGIKTLVIPANSTLDPNTFKANNEIPTLIEKLYCAPQMRQACEAAIAYRGDAAEVVEYQHTSDNQYLMGGKYYAKLSDIGTPNYIKKRIYTIDEANGVAGKTNTFSIRYR